jgi:hypothetical protein
MIAFDVYLNERKICTAGIGDQGVLSANVTWVRRKGKYTLSKKPGAVEEELTMYVSGLITPTKEHVNWQEPRPLHVGDAVRIKVVETEAVDQPSTRKQPDPARDERARKHYVRKMARQLGWKIVTK